MVHVIQSPGGVRKNVCATLKASRAPAAAWVRDTEGRMMKSFPLNQAGEHLRARLRRFGHVHRRDGDLGRMFTSLLLDRRPL